MATLPKQKLARPTMQSQSKSNSSQMLQSRIKNTNKSTFHNINNSSNSNSRHKSLKSTSQSSCHRSQSCMCQSSTIHISIQSVPSMCHPVWSRLSSTVQCMSTTLLLSRSRSLCCPTLASWSLRTLSVVLTLTADSCLLVTGEMATSVMFTMPVFTDTIARPTHVRLLERELILMKSLKGNETQLLVNVLETYKLIELSSPSDVNSFATIQLAAAQIVSSDKSA